MPPPTYCWLAETVDPLGWYVARTFAKRLTTDAYRARRFDTKEACEDFLSMISTGTFPYKLHAVEHGFG